MPRGMTREQWIERGSPKIPNVNPVKPYLPEYADIANRVMASGQTVRDAMRILGISKDTWLRWKREHEEFRAAVTRAKEEMCCKMVRSGFDRAMGYYYTEEETQGKATVGENGEVVPVPGTEIKVKRVRKHMPGEPRMLMFLLGGLEHQLEKERWPLKQMMDSARENGGGRIDVNAISKQIDRLVSAKGAEKVPPPIDATFEEKAQ